MQFNFLQKLVILFFSYKIVLQAHSFVVKRSPLEVGYATFPNEIVKHKTIVRAEKMVEDEDIDKDDDIPVSTTVTKVHHVQEWVPGQIRHHSFIPAHIHHIFVPVLITRDLQAVLVKPPESLYFYPKHYGGFGVGSYSGGQGAGHGFQIIFNQQ